MIRRLHGLAVTPCRKLFRSVCVQAYPRRMLRKAGISPTVGEISYVKHKFTKPLITALSAWMPIMD